MHHYGAVSISRLLKIIGLFCKRALLKRRYSAKETCNFKEPTTRVLGASLRIQIFFKMEVRMEEWVSDAGHCSMLQCVAVWCSASQCVAVCCSVVQCVAVCCSSVLRCVAVCIVLQSIVLHPLHPIQHHVMLEWMQNGYLRHKSTAMYICYILIYIFIY